MLFLLTKAPDMKNLFQLSVKNILVVILFSISFTAVAQPEYRFLSNTLDSGTALQVGAVYRFHNVKANTDALVKIKSFSGGITLSSIDEGGTGFNDALQPFINVGPNTNGFVELEIRFVTTATKNLVTQTYVPITCIDVDGQTVSDGVLYEKDQVQLKSGYYDFKASSASILVTNENNAGSDWVNGRNTHGAPYDGIDTSAQDVMFTVVNSNVNTLTVKTGAMNSSPTYFETRKRSFYFKSFTYQNSFLAVQGLNSFAANRTEQATTLSWNIDKSSPIQNMNLQTSRDGRNWYSLKEMSRLEGTVNGQNIRFVYNDRTLAPVQYYRIMVEEANGRKVYSDIIVTRASKSDSKNMTVYPTLISDAVTVSITTDAKGPGTIEIIDYSGKLVYRQNVKVENGVSQFMINGLSAKLAPGNYLVRSTVAGQVNTAKIVKAN
jgi:hypothetical protein